MRRLSCVLAACAAAALAPGTSLAATVAVWHPLHDYSQLSDIAGTRTDHTFVAAADGLLWLVDPEGGRYPFARGDGGFSYDAAAGTTIALPPAGGVQAGPCRFRQDDLYVPVGHDAPGMDIRKVDDRGRTSGFASSTVIDSVTGLTFDATGRFGGDLLVSGRTGEHGVVVAVDCGGLVVVIAQDLPPLHGDPAVAPAGFGQLSGALLLATDAGPVVALTPDGSRSELAVRGVDRISAISVVPPGVDGGGAAMAATAAGLVQLSAADLKAAGVRSGDVLLSSEMSTFDIRCAGCGAVRLATSTSPARGRVVVVPGQSAPTPTLPRDPPAGGAGAVILVIAVLAAVIAPVPTIGRRWPRSSRRHQGEQGPLDEDEAGQGERHRGQGGHHEEEDQVGVARTGEDTVGAQVPLGNGVPEIHPIGDGPEA